MLVSCGIEGNGARRQLFADKDRTVGLRLYALRAASASENSEPAEAR